LQSEATLNLAKIQEIAASGRRDDQKLRLMEKELADKVQIASQDIAGRQKVAETEAGSRVDVANIDVASRNQVARLDLAAKLLDQIRLAKDSDKKSQTDFLSDISRMPGMKPEDVAGTAAEMGNPAMLNALNKSRANLIDNQIRGMIPGYVKAKPADKLKMEEQANLLDPNAGKRLSALAYPATAGGQAPELSLRQPTAPAPGPAAAPNAPVSGNVSTSDVVNSILRTAIGPGGGEAGGGAVTSPVAARRAADQVYGPPIGPPGTAQLSRIEALKAAGQPYVAGGSVYNQPAGTAGMDYNVSTGEWVPKESVGTINGRPANVAIRNPVYSNMLAEHGVAPAMNIAELGRHGVASMTPETTTGQPLTPSLVPAPSGGVQASVRPVPIPAGMTDLGAPPPPVTVPMTTTAPVNPDVGVPGYTAEQGLAHRAMAALFGGRPPWVSDADVAAQRAAEEARRKALEDAMRARQTAQNQ
jgi:hypothetical protein